ncbi:Retrovirus-related Pol polyprotein from transposon TNT 1-94 [Trichinella britovi]|uniref:Retrovirus-related Pol polyprotein from transposon TNT 1-94 n=1 Tax=Trichinella britovi TaxID=45882 RepID=A0A0V1DFA8_TRIBR|nr:Retrovirus-related Pol polyprotein from transposon TNT 1-94 [Trichinella britovi]
MFVSSRFTAVEHAPKKFGHLMAATRPDFAYAVSTVSQVMDKPTLAVKRIFRYLRGTADYGLLYQANGEGVLKGYSNADYVGDVTTRRSRTGVVCTCAGGAVSWHSQKQKSVELSTTEAEYVAASEGAKDMMWLMSLFAEVTEVKQKPILFVDNMGAVKLSKIQSPTNVQITLKCNFTSFVKNTVRAKSTSCTSIAKTRRQRS